jgi:tellurite resistance protein TehA-like permease
MIRQIAIEIGLFLVPFVLYALFLVATNVGIVQPKAWTPPRLVGLLIVSLLLVVASFLVLAQFSGAPPGSTYVPAHVENGKFVPGKTQR